MHTIWRKAGIGIVLMILLFSGIPAAAALEAPDLDRNGEIIVTMLDPTTQEPIAGGTVTLYRVGDAVKENANYSFALTSEFELSGETLTELDAELAKRLAEYAESRGTCRRN